MSRFCASFIPITCGRRQNAAYAPGSKPRSQAQAPFNNAYPGLQVQPPAAEQPVHDAPELAGQVAHVASAVAASVEEYFPVPQLVQTALPVAILYFPAAQGEHTPPLGPVYPTLQVQTSRAVLATGELELAGHARQVVATVAPTVVEYVPVPQSVQTALPVVILYFPAAQGRHTPPSGPVYPTLQVQAAVDVLPIGEFVPAGHVKHEPVIIPLPPPGHTWPHEAQQLLHVPNSEYGMQFPSHAAPGANNEQP